MLRIKSRFFLRPVIIFILGILFITIFAGTLIFISDKKKGEDIKNFKTIVSNSRGEIPLEIVNSYYDKIGPDLMLDAVESETYCHEKGHNIGKVIYRKNEDLGLSLTKCSYRCTTGCFHGVLMEYFKQESSSDAHIKLEDIKDKVEKICDSKEIAVNKIQKGVCIHGVGHSLEFLADNDIERALKYCELFKDEGSIYYCATGVFMEWDIVNGRRYKNADSLFPCDKFNFPSACFRYKIARTFKEDEYPQAREFCLKISNDNLRAGCFHGLGFRFFRLLNNGHSLKYICNSDYPQDNKMCIEGGIGVLSVFNKQRSIDLCNELSGSEKEYCLKSSEQSNFGMQKDFSDYFIYLK